MTGVVDAVMPTDQRISRKPRAGHGVRPARTRMDPDASGRPAKRVQPAPPAPHSRESILGAIR